MKIIIFESGALPSAVRPIGQNPQAQEHHSIPDGSEYAGQPTVRLTLHKVSSDEKALNTVVSLSESTSVSRVLIVPNMAMVEAVHHQLACSGHGRAVSRDIRQNEDVVEAHLEASVAATNWVRVIHFGLPDSIDLFKGRLGHAVGGALLIECIVVLSEQTYQAIDDRIKTSHNRTMDKLNALLRLNQLHLSEPVTFIAEDGPRDDQELLRIESESPLISKTEVADLLMNAQREADHSLKIAREWREMLFAINFDGHAFPKANGLRTKPTHNAPVTTSSDKRVDILPTVAFEKVAGELNVNLVSLFHAWVPEQLRAQWSTFFFSIFGDEARSQVWLPVYAVNATMATLGQAQSETKVKFDEMIAACGPDWFKAGMAKYLWYKNIFGIGTVPTVQSTPGQEKKVHSKHKSVFGEGLDLKTATRLLRVVLGATHGPYIRRRKLAVLNRSFRKVKACVF